MTVFFIFAEINFLFLIIFQISRIIIELFSNINDFEQEVAFNNTVKHSRQVIHLAF